MTRAAIPARELEALEVEQVVASVAKGATLEDAAAEAILLAMAERRPVRFEFNGEVFNARPGELINQVIYAANIERTRAEAMGRSDR